MPSADAPFPTARDAARDLRATDASAAWERLASPLLVLALVAWGVVLFRPWIDAPFEFWDWGDFGPVLRQGSSFGERHRLLTGFYAGHGRYLPLTLLYTNLKWTAFGLDVRAWQWAEAALMAVNVAMAFWFGRRLGASRAGAAAGAAGMVLFASMAQAWLRVHVSQPEGLPFVTGAALLAIGLGERERWLPRAVAIGALVAVAILVKETFVAVVPFLLLLACCTGEDASWHAPAIDRRAAGIAVVVGSLALAAVVPILVVKAGAPAASYAAMYDSGAIDARGVALKLRTMVFPMGDSARRLLADALLVTLVVIGLAARHRRGAAATWALVVTALALPLAGAAVHLPWPGHGPHYASSYVLGAVLLVALATTHGLRARGAARAGTVAMLALVAVAGSLSAAEQRRNFVGMRRAHRALVDATAEAAREAGAREVLVRVRDTTAHCLYCAMLTDMARAFHDAPLPPVRAVSCADGVAARRAGILVVSESLECPDAMPRARFDVALLQSHRFSGRPSPADSLHLSIHLDDGTAVTAHLRAASGHTRPERP